MRKEEIQKLLELPAAERLKVVQELLESLDADADALPISDAQRKLLDERLDAYLANPEDVLTWPEVKSKLPGA